MAKRSISSLKRVRQNRRRRVHNQARASALKTQLRRARDLIAAGDPAKADTQFRSAVALLDREASRGRVHRNTAARRKSRLMRQLNALKAARK